MFTDPAPLFITLCYNDYSPSCPPMDSLDMKNHPLRPFVTLSYAQSLDGSIATARKEQILLSCPESLAYAHRLRADNDAVLIGIGTVLADNPRLSVRYARGADPLPVILDSLLRFPVNANLLRNPSTHPLIVTTYAADEKRREKLERLGARVMAVAADGNGIDLATLLFRLYETGIKKIMVEGGAQVIASFLRDKLVDRLIITISPVLVGGLAPFFGVLRGTLPALANISRRTMGRDIVIQAEPRWIE